MFINGIPFLTSISQIITFGMATEMEGANMDNVVTVLKTINVTYKSRGFNILSITAGGGFHGLRQT